MGKLRVRVDQQKCIGAGQCVMESPEVFDQGEDGIVVLLVEEPDSSLAAAVKQAAKLCPAAAIFIDEIQ